MRIWLLLLFWPVVLLYWIVKMLLLALAIPLTILWGLLVSV